jgi:hypothetical protein
VQVEELRILLALEPVWTVSLNDLDFSSLPAAEISFNDSTIRFGPHVRTIVGLKWLRPNVLQIRARSRFRSNLDVITLYPGDRLPSTVDVRRRRRLFQKEIGPALCGYFGTRKLERQVLYSDRHHGIGGAYLRFLINRQAVIAVDPDETTAVINGIMRAALAWAPLVRRKLAIVVPRYRSHTVSTRLRFMPHLRYAFQWLQWDGSSIKPLVETDIRPETHVQEFVEAHVDEEVARIRGIAPELLQAVPCIASQAVSIGLRGIEVARVSKSGVTYPLGTPLEQVIRELADARRYGSRHPLAYAHEERWLESNLIGQIHQLLPSVDARHIYPQVPSFVGEERNIIDLLTITDSGRLVVIEIKASADPDLPFQAFDYWLAVERHRNAGDFVAKGYFSGCRLLNQSAILVLVAPLLSYHKAVNRLVSTLPASVPLMQIGINQNWKQRVKILRRRGMVS